MINEDSQKIYTKTNSFLSRYLRLCVYVIDAAIIFVYWTSYKYSQYCLHLLVPLYTIMICNPTIWWHPEESGSFKGFFLMLCQCFFFFYSHLIRDHGPIRNLSLLLDFCKAALSQGILLKQMHFTNKIEFNWIVFNFPKKGFEIFKIYCKVFLIWQQHFTVIHDRAINECWDVLWTRCFGRCVQYIYF